MEPVHLHPHPATLEAAIRALTVSVRRTSELRLRFRLDGAIGSLRIPESCASPGHADGLWEHTCFEAFLAAAGSPRYWEFNFSPSGEWARYGFRGYRDRMTTPALAELPPPSMEWAVTGGSLELEAGIPLARSSDLAAAPLRVALAAVVEARDGGRSYWALRHPPGKPDFHHPDGFAILLEPASPATPSRARG
jgi:hypothetical protein